MRSDEKVKKFNIMVTGISGIPGYGVMEALSASKYDCNIIGVGIYDNAAGRQWCDIFEKGPKAEDLEFINFIYDLIIKYKIDLVIPTVEPEIIQFFKHKKMFENLNTKFVLHDIDLFNKLNDKSNTYNYLKGKIAQIPTIIGSDDLSYSNVVDKLDVPFILKKNISSGSHGVITINDQKDFEYWKYKFSDGFICQKKIIGQEYTISVFGLQTGKYVNMIVFSRTLKNGTTMAAECIDPDNKIIEYVDKLCEIMSPVGPTNIQLIKDQESDKYLLLEVNARISASTSIRYKLGINEPDMCIEYYLLNKIPDKRIFRKASAIRYLKDLVEYHDSKNL